jgi:hypothetical protein
MEYIRRPSYHPLTSSPPRRLSPHLPVSQSNRDLGWRCTLVGNAGIGGLDVLQQIHQVVGSL